MVIPLIGSWLCFSKGNRKEPTYSHARPAYAGTNSPYVAHGSQQQLMGPVRTGQALPTEGEALGPLAHHRHYLDMAAAKNFTPQQQPMSQPRTDRTLYTEGEALGPLAKGKQQLDMAAAKSFNSSRHTTKDTVPERDGDAQLGVYAQYAQPNVYVPPYEQPSVHVAAAAPEHVAPAMHRVGPAHVRPSAAAPSTSRLSPTALPVSAAASDLSQGALQRHNGAQASGHKQSSSMASGHDAEEVDEEWVALLTQVDAELAKSGHPILQQTERPVAVWKMRAATGNRGPQFAVRTCMEEIIRRRSSYVSHPYVHVAPIDQPSAHVAAAAPEHLTPALHQVGPAQVRPYVSVPSTSRLPPMGPAPPAASAAASDLSQGALQRHNGAQAGSHNRGVSMASIYDTEELDEEWVALLTQVDAELVKSGQPTLKQTEQPAAIYKLVQATGTRGAQFAIRACMEEVLRRRASHASAPSASRLPPLGPTPPSASAAASDLSQGALQRHNGAQAGAHKRGVSMASNYDTEELDEEWVALLTQVDAELLKSGQPTLQLTEQPMAVHKLIQATGTRGAQFAIRACMEEVVLRRASHAAAPGASRLPPMGPAALPVSAAASNLSQGALQRHNGAQAGGHKRGVSMASIYDTEELDEDWVALLTQVDVELVKSGQPILKQTEQPVAIRKLVEATGTRGAQFAIKACTEEVILHRFRKA